MVAEGGGQPLLRLLQGLQLAGSVLRDLQPVHGRWRAREEGERGQAVRWGHVKRYRGREGIGGHEKGYRGREGTGFSLGEREGVLTGDSAPLGCPLAHGTWSLHSLSVAKYRLCSWANTKALTLAAGHMAKESVNLHPVAASACRNQSQRAHSFQQAKGCTTSTRCSKTPDGAVERWRVVACLCESGCVAL